MNLEEMRTRFVAHTSDLANDLTNSDIDAYLNRAYQHAIPGDVDGTLSDIIWAPVVANGASSTAIQPHVIGLDKSVANISYLTSPLNWERLIIRDDYIRFSLDWPDRTTATGLPDEACRYGRTLYFNRVTDATCTLEATARGGNPIPLTTSGLTNDTHALAVITSAAMEFLAEAEDADGLNRESALYSMYKSRLHTISQAGPNRRRWKRSF